MTNWIITFPSKGTDTHRFWFCYYLVKYEQSFTNSIWFGTSFPRWSARAHQGWIVTAQGPWVPWAVVASHVCSWLRWSSCVWVAATGSSSLADCWFYSCSPQPGMFLSLLATSLKLPALQDPLQTHCLGEGSGATQAGRCPAAHSLLLTSPGGPPAALWTVACSYVFHLCVL